MKYRAFVGGTAILPNQLLEQAVVVCQGERIASIGTTRDFPADTDVVDCTGNYLSPGFVDMHVHGADGADFMDGTVEAVRTSVDAHARHGTTTIFPTTTTGSPAQILAMLEACAAVAAERRGATIAGVHLYGPFFAEEKVGCHSLAGRRSPTAAEFDAYFRSGQVKIATCAAELPGADHFYRAAGEHGCLITCGHSDASWSEMQSAFTLGMRHVDHFWCAMSSVPSLRKRLGVPMQASMAEFVLMHHEMSTEVIADGCHLAPELLEFAYRMKGPERLCLVTDCNRGLDCPPGEYRFGNQQDGSWFKSDGQVGWALDGLSLASSIRGMDHMVRHMAKHTSASLPEVVRMGSLTPAERTGIQATRGSLSVGKQADLLVLSQQLEVEQVYVAGQLFHPASV